MFIFLLGALSEAYLAQRDYPRFVPARDKHLAFLEPRYTYTKATRYNVLCVGCSFTYGWGVKATEAFPYQLGELRPDCTFDNAGICAGGGYDSVVQMRRFLSKYHYDCVIYAAIANHLLRGTLISMQLDRAGAAVGDQSQAGEDTYPIILGNNMHTITYQNDEVYFPGASRLRLMYFLSGAYMELRQMLLGYQRRDYLERKYKYEIRTMYTLAKEHGCSFGVVGLYGFAPHNTLEAMHHWDKPLTAFTQSPIDENDIAIVIPTLDANYPLDFMSRPDLNVAHDALRGGDHPTPKVYAHYARCIAEWISREHLLPN